MNFGKTLKEIRISQGLSQDALCIAGLSRTSISKIENGKQNPSFEKAILIIDALGVSIDEFVAIASENKYTQKRKIIDRFIMLSTSQQKEQITNLYRDTCLFLKNELDRDIRVISTVLKVMLNFNIYSMEEKKKIVEPVWEELSKIEVWKKLDLYIINDILYLFDGQESEYMIDYSIRILRKRFPSLKNLELSFLMNKSALLLFQKRIPDALAILNECATLSKEINRYDMYLIIKIRIALASNEIDRAKYNALLLKEIGADKLATGMFQEINEFNGL